MKRRLHKNPTHTRGRNTTKARARLALLLVAALALAYAAVSTTSLAQTKKRRPARTQPSQETLVNMETPESAARAASLPRPGRAAAERPSAERDEQRRSARYRQQEQEGSLGTPEIRRERGRAEGRPREWRLRKARTFFGDLRQLPQTKSVMAERPEREGPEPSPAIFVPPGQDAPAAQEEPAAPTTPESNAPAPPPSGDFDGLDFNTYGNGHPPDTVGDVGPNHYIQSINSSVGIFSKSGGPPIAAFSLNAFMSQGNFGNLCDTNNFGDPVVLYDTFEDRWVITDFAFQLSGGAVVNPPGAFQCIAVSRNGDPVSGGWNFYSVNTAGGLGDYPKLGVWTDGIYMSVNMFGYPANAPFQNPRVYAFNKAQMYAGAPTVQVVSFDAPAADFTVLPSNARLQTGTPPAGTPNYFLSSWQFLNALTVYKFHVDWDHPALSTFTGPDVPIAATSWPNAAVANAPSQGGNSLDVLQIRAMMQNQYTNFGGAESLWAIHTVRRANTTGFAAPRFYQVPVTGGVVGPNITQAATFDPDGANVMHRFMPSLAVDRAGNMMFGYSTSSSTTKPAIKYAGRLATDPINTFSQTEQLLVQGAGTQTGLCGGVTCTRWGDYSAMSLDPDGCTFWYTNMFYKVDGLNHQTHIGKFKLSQCTTVGNGGVQGNVTSGVGGGPVAGATVSLGSRTTTTDAAGFYSFSNIPAGTYPGMTATFPGYTSGSASNVVVNEGGVTVQNFTLSPAAGSACLTDTTQLDFQTGTATGVDLTSSPGDVTLSNAPFIDQQNTTLGTQGLGFNTTTWPGQTFTPAVTGQLTRVDLNLFSLNCAAVTMPNITVSVRNASGNLPTAGPDLATATIPGFCNGAGGFFTANFAAPATLNAGTQYAIVLRAAAAIPAGSPAPGYFATVSVGTGSVALQNPYAGGRRASSGNSGVTWAGAAGNANNDHGFIAYMQTGYPATGTLVSGLKDSNPYAGGTTNWTTLSWNASGPGGTSVKFRVAASNSPYGPFNFVGPGGTSAPADYFTTSGASLAQFNGFRYLKYQATLTTGSPTVTPTLSDVTVCFDRTIPTTLTVGSATGTYGGTVSLAAKLSDGVSPVAGQTVNFTLNGNGVGSAVTDGSGIATLANASLAGINAGSYPAGVGAGFAASAPYLASNATNALTVNKADATINVVGFNGTYDGNPHGASGTATGAGGEDLSSLLNFGATYTNVPGGTAHWTFNAGGTNGNYNSAAGDVAIVITQATPSVTWNNPADIVYGTALGATQLNATASVPGAFVYTPAAGAVLNAGNGQPLHVAFTPTDTVNYTTASADVSINVLKAPLTIKADDKSRLVAAPNPPFTATFVGFVNGDGPGSLSGTLVFNTPATPASPAGNYPITPSGVTSTNYQITFVNGTLHVGFNVCVDYDETKAKNSGSTVPVKFRLCDASGANLSASSIVVQAVGVVNAVTNAPQPLQDAGNANPGNYFRYDGGGYIFNLKTTGYPAGTYKLNFTVGGDPTPHSVQFAIR